MKTGTSLEITAASVNYIGNVHVPTLTFKMDKQKGTGKHVVHNVVHKITSNFLTST